MMFLNRPVETLTLNLKNFVCRGDDCRHQVTTPKATGVIRRITTTPAPRVRFAVDHGDDDDIYSEAPTIKVNVKYFL